MPCGIKMVSIKHIGSNLLKFISKNGYWKIYIIKKPDGQSSSGFLKYNNNYFCQNLIYYPVLQIKAFYDFDPFI